ncbi:MAG: hypothetical protein LUH07_03565 [Lachnospiraceae bacterium]|nr:hypothetical protein [Lachnospiraceae bacterium]
MLTHLLLFVQVFFWSCCDVYGEIFKAKDYKNLEIMPQKNGSAAKERLL